MNHLVFHTMQSYIPLVALTIGAGMFAVHRLFQQHIMTYSQQCIDHDCRGKPLILGGEDLHWGEIKKPILSRIQEHDSFLYECKDNYVLLLSKKTNTYVFTTPEFVHINKLTHED